jgi:signal transduction histidine kinase
MTKRTAARLAWSMALASLAAVGSCGYLVARGGQSLTSHGSQILIAVVYSVVGVVVASRRHENNIGWILLAIGLSFALSAATQTYTDRGSLVGRAAPFAGQWVHLVGTLIWAPGWTLIITLLLLLFPDGHLPSRRWRPVAFLAVGSMVGMMLGSFFAVNLNPSSVPTYRNPIATPTLGWLSNVFLLFGLPAALAAAIACVLALVQRYRRSRGEERQQMKWFAYAGVATLLLLPGNTVAATTPILQAMGFVSIPLLPAAIAVAVFRYRLYDVDVVISKTVVYTALAGFITAVYVAIVVGLGAVIGAGTSKPNLGLSILATAVVAVAFQPVRSRVQRFANRLVYGKRATPYEVLSEFSSRMAESYASEDLLPRMARILAEGTGARSAVVWLKVGAQWKPDGAWPMDGRPSPNVKDLTDIDATLTLAVEHRGEQLGALSLTKAAGDRLTPAEEHLANDLASGAGLVLRNVRLTEELLERLEELRASRQRIVSAQDHERRRLERNIHDGAQQQLVALAVKTRLARSLLSRDPGRAVSMLAEVEAEVSSALEDLRDLARGIYPPLLADQGLVAALRAQARRAAIPVEVEAPAIGRFSQDVEAAVYFCALEALQNVSKYANATLARVRLSETDDLLTFEVADDGDGFEPSATPFGTGLQGMADRLSALGGQIEVASRIGSGTTVTGRMPVRALETVG